MSKKHFIALADAIREHNRVRGQYGDGFSDEQLDTLARFMASQNANFMRDRWLDYIAGKCGPNGGAIKKVA